MSTALNLLEANAENDWLSDMLGQDVFSNGWAVDIPTYAPANDDYVMSDVEAEFDEFLSFIVDFQARNKG